MIRIRKENTIEPSATHPAPVLAYSGLRVLDASQGLAGPYCAMLLAQHGATVIKLEPPQGDWSRGIGSRFGEQTALSLSCNRGKRSLAIDLKREGAVDLVQRVASQCDVVLESFRPGVAARIGLGYEALAAARPGLIYASVSGYGQDGPYSERPATDTVIQAFSGVMSLNRDSQGRPNRIGFLVIDTLTGLYAHQAIAAALYARREGGPGQRLDISLMQATAAFLGQRIIELGLQGSGEPKAFNAPAGVYQTQDGWVAIALSNEEHFNALCRALERADLRADARYRDFESRADHLPALLEQVSASFLTRSTAHWVERISAEGGLVNPVNTLAQWAADPHVQATQAAPTIERSGTGRFQVPRIPGIAPPAPDDARGEWPGIGTDGASLLAELGFAADEIDRLRAQGILFHPAH